MKDLLLIILIFSLIGFNCKEKNEDTIKAKKDFMPNIQFASFIEELTHRCTADNPEEIELKNPGFTQIIEASQFVRPAEKDYPALSPAIRLEIISQAKDIRHGQNIYFIRDSNTISFQMSSKDMDCSFPYQGPILKDVITVHNLAPKYRQDRD